MKVKEITVTLYGDASNNAVISMPGRRFPGVLVQGDTLKNLLDSSEVVLKFAKQIGNEGLRDEAIFLYDSLSDMYEWYRRDAGELVDE
ncbi:DUF6959 family protein [Luteimonas sp. R10]|uniref:DUF6959 family protein n=1 Tax=Luteimonas sp. R10 TaxID=3108176 RepID=UPI00308F3611|nr:hypothetical protein U3649_01520 [Luteimonas sp. R10]